MGLIMDASLEIHFSVEVGFGLLYFYSYVMENFLTILDVDVEEEEREKIVALGLEIIGGYGL